MPPKAKKVLTPGTGVHRKNANAQKKTVKPKQRREKETKRGRPSSVKKTRPFTPRRLGYKAVLHFLNNIETKFKF